MFLRDPGRKWFKADAVAAPAAGSIKGAAHDFMDEFYGAPLVCRPTDGTHCTARMPCWVERQCVFGVVAASAGHPSCTAALCGPGVRSPMMRCSRSASAMGIKTFSPAGRFSLVIVQADLPRISSNDPMKPSAEEAEAIVRGSIAYYGTYGVDEASKTINMQLDGTTLTNQLGILQQRNIDLIRGDELRYSNLTGWRVAAQVR